MKADTVHWRVDQSRKNMATRLIRASNRANGTWARLPRNVLYVIPGRNGTFSLEPTSSRDRQKGTL